MTTGIGGGVAGGTTSIWRGLLHAPVLGLAMAIMMGRLLVYARLLPIEQFADLSLGLLVSGSIGMLNCLGLQSVAQREVPRMLLGRREAAAHVLLMQCLLICLGYGLLALLVCAFIALSGMEHAIVFSAGLLHGVAQQIFLVGTLDSRSRGNAQKYSNQNLTRSLLACVAGSAFAFYCNQAIPALVAESAVSLLLGGIYLSHSGGSKPIAFVTALRLAASRLQTLPWRAMLSFLAVSLLAFWLMSFDRWLGARVLEARDFAVYSFAAIVLTVAQAVQAMVNASVFPYLVRKNHLEGAGATFAACARVSGVTAAIGLAAFVPAYFGLRWFVPRISPQYSGAIPVLPAMFAVAILRCADFWSSCLLVLRSEGRLVSLNAILGFAAAVLFVAVVASGVRPGPMQLAWMACAFSVVSFFGARTLSVHALREAAP